MCQTLFLVLGSKWSVRKVNLSPHKVTSTMGKTVMEIVVAEREESQRRLWRVKERRAMVTGGHRQTVVGKAHMRCPQTPLMPWRAHAFSPFTESLAWAVPALNAGQWGGHAQHGRPFCVWGCATPGDKTERTSENKKARVIPWLATGWWT